jgi:hypothetical protein
MVCNGWGRAPVQKEEGDVGQNVENLGAAVQSVTKKDGGNVMSSQHAPDTADLQAPVVAARDATV